MRARDLIQKSIVLMMLAVASFATGCQPSNEVLVEKGDSTVLLKAGQVLVVRLESNPTTGYSWIITECDEAVLAVQGEAEYVPEEGAELRVGSGGVEVFRLKAVEPGQTHLQLAYQHSWEVDVEPVETFEMDVTVQ